MKKKGKKKSGKRKVHKRNLAALLTAIIIAILGLMPPFFSSNLFEEGFSDRNSVMANRILDLFSGSISFSNSYEIVILSMVLVYLITLVLYLLNSSGFASEKYSKYASILAVVYFFLCLFAVILMNKALSVPIFGNTLGTMKVSLGTYLIAIAGISYLFFKEKINQAIKF